MKKLKNILFITATHGDEGFSVDIMRRIEKRFPKRKYGYDWVIGNPEAFKKNVRFIDTDLNRAAPGDKKSKHVEYIRADEILELSKKFDTVIDIHGTVASSGIAIIIPLPRLENIMLSNQLPVKNVVIWNSKKSATNGPLVQFCTCPAIEIECGPMNDPQIARDLEQVIEKILINNRSCNPGYKGEASPNKDYYFIYGKEKRKLVDLADFRKCIVGNEEFFPFLTNQYSNITCYKMRKIIFEDLFKY